MNNPHYSSSAGFFTEGQEVFCPVNLDGFRECYKVSNHGRVMSGRDGINTSFGKVLKPSKDSDGYFHVNLKNGKQRKAKVHRLVLLTFVGEPPDGCEACHNDGNKLNNRVKNLRWDSPKANAADRDQHGTTAKGENHGRARLTEADVLEVHGLYRSGMSSYQIAEQFGIDPANVGRILSGKHWGHLNLQTDIRQRFRATEADVARILELRSKGLLQREIAEIIGCDPTTIGKILKNSLKDS